MRPISIWRRFRKRRPIVWINRYSSLQERYWRMAYSGKRSIEWAHTKYWLLNKISVVRALR